MSATRDKNQKVTFVYSNLYRLYQQGKDAAMAAEPAVAANPAPVSGAVLKSEDLHQKPYLDVRPYRPAELIGKRVAKPAVIAPVSVPGQSSAVESLKKNLQQLNDLHSRLRFMLQELEDLVKE